MKRILYLLLGFLIAGYSLSAQQFPRQVEAPGGVWINPTQLQPIVKRDFVTYVYPRQGKFWYDSLGVTYPVNFQVSVGLGLTLGANNIVSVKQQPDGTIGNVMVNQLWYNPTPALFQTLGANNLAFRNATTGEVQFLAANAIPQRRWVDPPLNADSPGLPGDESAADGKFYEYKRVDAFTWKWVESPGNTTFQRGQNSSDRPTGLTLALTTVPNQIRGQFSYTGTAQSFDAVISADDSLHYQSAVAGIPGGDRSFVFGNTSPGKRYYMAVRATTQFGATAYSNSATITMPSASNRWQDITNINFSPSTGKLTFTVADAGGNVRVDYSKNLNAQADPADPQAQGWVYLDNFVPPTSGNFSVDVKGLATGEQFVVRLLRWGKDPVTGQDKESAPWNKQGPYNYGTAAPALPTPTIAGTLGGSTGDRATLTFNTSYQGGVTWAPEVNIDGGGWNTLQTTTSSTFDAGTQTPGSTYQYRTRYTPQGTSTVSGYSSTISLTVQAASICNVSDNATGGYNGVTKSYTINFDGTVYYMLDTGTIPDGLIVKKNGTTVASPYAASYRTRGQVSVVKGDKIDFVINPKVTGDQGTGWTFYANCNTPYNVDQPQTNYAYGNKDFPRITQITSDEPTQNTRRFTITGAVSRATGAAITGYKAVPTTASFNANSGWYGTPTITQDQAGSAIVPSRTYAVYVRDANNQVFGIGGVTTGGYYEEDVPPTPEVPLSYYAPESEFENEVFHPERIWPQLNLPRWKIPMFNAKWSARPGNFVDRPDILDVKFGYGANGALEPGTFHKSPEMDRGDGAQPLPNYDPDYIAKTFLPISQRSLELSQQGTGISLGTDLEAISPGSIDFGRVYRHVGTNDQDLGPMSEPSREEHGRFNYMNININAIGGANYNYSITRFDIEHAPIDNAPYWWIHRNTINNGEFRHVLNDGSNPAYMHMSDDEWYENVWKYKVTQCVAKLYLNTYQGLKNQGVADEDIWVITYGAWGDRGSTLWDKRVQINGENVPTLREMRYHLEHPGDMLAGYTPYKIISGNDLTWLALDIATAPMKETVVSKKPSRVRIIQLNDINSQFPQLRVRLEDQEGNIAKDPAGGVAKLSVAYPSNGSPAFETSNIFLRSENDQKPDVTVTLPQPVDVNWWKLNSNYEYLQDYALCKLNARSETDRGIGKKRALRQWYPYTCQLCCVMFGTCFPGQGAAGQCEDNSSFSVPARVFTGMNFLNWPEKITTAIWQPNPGRNDAKLGGEASWRGNVGTNSRYNTFEANNIFAQYQDIQNAETDNFNSVPFDVSYDGGSTWIPYATYINSHMYDGNVANKRAVVKIGWNQTTGKGYIYGTPAFTDNITVQVRFTRPGASQQIKTLNLSKSLRSAAYLERL